MNLRAYRTFQALILAGLGVFLFSLVTEGELETYTSPNLALLPVLSALGLVLLAQWVLRVRPSRLEETTDPRETHAHGPAQWELWLALLALPLWVGFLRIEPAPSALDAHRQGIQQTAPLWMWRREQPVTDIPTSQRSVLDWIRIANSSADRTANGDPSADVTGFVVYDAHLPQGQFFLTRFVVPCCTNQAVAVGIVTIVDSAAALPEDTWVRVRGSIQSVDVDGSRQLRLRARQVEVIPAPAQPYLVP